MNKQAPIDVRAPAPEMDQRLLAEYGIRRVVRRSINVFATQAVGLKADTGHCFISLPHVSILDGEDAAP